MILADETCAVTQDLANDLVRSGRAELASR